MSTINRRALISILDLDDEHIKCLYNGFDSPIASLGCGKKCAPHNPSGKPFCRDICHTVPAAYKSEWKYLEPNANLWLVWRGNECGNVTSKERLNS